VKLGKVKRKTLKQTAYNYVILVYLCIYVSSI